MSEKVMSGHSTVDTGPDHRAPVSTLKIAAHNFVQSPITQDQGFQFQTFCSQHINCFLIFVRKPKGIIIPSEKKYLFMFHYTQILESDRPWLNNNKIDCQTTVLNCLAKNCTFCQSIQQIGSATQGVSKIRHVKFENI